LLERTSSIEIDRDQSPRWFDSLQVRRHEYLPVTLVPAPPKAQLPAPALLA
jgi:hypothetical protein